MTYVGPRTGTRLRKRGDVFPGSDDVPFELNHDRVSVVRRIWSWRDARPQPARSDRRLARFRVVGNLDDGRPLEGCRELFPE